MCCYLISIFTAQYNSLLSETEAAGVSVGCTEPVCTLLELCLSVLLPLKPYLTHHDLPEHLYSESRMNT